MPKKQEKHVSVQHNKSSWFDLWREAVASVFVSPSERYFKRLKYSRAELSRSGSFALPPNPVPNPGPNTPKPRSYWNDLPYRLVSYGVAFAFFSPVNAYLQRIKVHQTSANPSIPLVQATKEVFTQRRLFLGVPAEYLRRVSMFALLGPFIGAGKDAVDAAPPGMPTYAEIAKQSFKLGGGQMPFCLLEVFLILQNRKMAPERFFSKQSAELLATPLFWQRVGAQMLPALRRNVMFFGGVFSINGALNTRDYTDVQRWALAFLGGGAYAVAMTPVDTVVTRRTLEPAVKETLWKVVRSGGGWKGALVRAGTHGGLNAAVQVSRSVNAYLNEVAPEPCDRKVRTEPFVSDMDDDSLAVVGPDYNDEGFWLKYYRQRSRCDNAEQDRGVE